MNSSVTECTNVSKSDSACNCRSELKCWTVGEIIGDRLRSAREALQSIESPHRHMSRRELCELVNKHIEEDNRNLGPLLEDTYRHWESGRATASVEYIPLLCDVLHCEIGYLFGIYPWKNTVLSNGAEAQLKSKGDSLRQQWFRLPNQYNEIEILSLLLESPSFWSSLTALSRSTDPMFVSTLNIWSGAATYINTVYNETPGQATEYVERAIIPAASSIAIGHFTAAVTAVLESIMPVDK